MRWSGARHRGYSLIVFSLLFVGLFALVLLQYNQIRQLRQDLNGLVVEQRVSEVRDISPESDLKVELCSVEIEVTEPRLEDISRSVCLIQGEYLFTDNEGALVSWQEIDSVVSLSNSVQNTAKTTHHVDIQYTGSGFLVGADGYIITNKHVALPWSQTERDRRIIDAGFRPRMVMFRAFFPGQERPYDLEFVSSSPEDDIALVKIVGRACTIPALECDFSAEYRVGMPVTILGYPTGFDLLTATIGTAGHQLDYSCFDGLGQELSVHNLIQPMATSGICGQVNNDKIAYDAATTIGASGAPVLDSKGKVIAVNAALLKGFSGTNFGVPVNRVKLLLDSVFQ